MVKAIRKPLEEIVGLVADRARVLIVGCGGCASVCLAGGQRETLALAADLVECRRQKGGPIDTTCWTVERQCDAQYLAELDEMARDCDCALSMACGAGAQHLSDAYPTLPVFPAWQAAQLTAGTPSPYL